eukprot:1308657-Heterocapsa_arctica.AAC.1
MSTSCLVVVSGVEGYRGEPSLSPSDAQRKFEPEKYNGSQQNVKGSLNNVRYGQHGGHSV